VASRFARWHILAKFAFTISDDGMNNLTKEKAQQLNELFQTMLTWDHSKKTLSFINVVAVSKEIPSLMGKTDAYIKHLLYIARLEQKSIPELFSGDTLIALTEPSVRDFLAQGGFLTLYKKHRLATRKDNFRFWLIAIVTILTLAITIQQAYFVRRQDKSNSKQGKTASDTSIKANSKPPIKKDSTRQIH
jgi:hypothetical protein